MARHLLWICAPILFLALWLSPAFAQDAAKRGDASWLLPVPELQIDAKVPTLQDVVGHRWAQEISSHAEIERYVQALAKAAPDRCRLAKSGQSYEGKTLYNLIIT